MNDRIYEKLRALHDELSQLDGAEAEAALDLALRTDPELMIPFEPYLEDPNVVEMAICVLSGATIH